LPPHGTLPILPCDLNPLVLVRLRIDQGHLGVFVAKVDSRRFEVLPALDVRGLALAETVRRPAVQPLPFPEFIALLDRQPCPPFLDRFALAPRQWLRWRKGAVAGSVDRLLVTIHAVTLPGKDLGLPFGPAQLAWLHARPSQSAFLGSNAGDGLGGREEIGLQPGSQARLQDLGRLGTCEDHAA